MLVELLQLLPDPLVLLSDKTVFSSPKAPNSYVNAMSLLCKVCYIGIYLCDSVVEPWPNNLGPKRADGKHNVGIFDFNYRLRAQIKITGIAGDVAIGSSCMLGMLSRSQNLQRCSFSDNFVCLKEASLECKPFHTLHT